MRVWGLGSWGSGWARLVGALALLLFLGAPAIEVSAQEPGVSAAKTQKPKTWKQTCVRMLLGSALIAIPAAALPTAYHDSNAHAASREHIGRGIYFDYANFLAALEPGERAIVENARSNPLPAIHLLTQRLSGSEGDWGLKLFPRARDAEEFLAGASNNRGVCRHKALVLAAVLSKSGVRAEVHSGTTGLLESWHVWVYLPEHDLVADPMANRVLNAEAYESEYYIHLNTVPMPRGWY